MKPVARIALNIFLGALVGFFISAASFSLISIIDGTGVGEALGYGAVVGVIGAFLGSLIGFLVGILKLGAPGGAMAGLLVTAALILFYVLSFSRPGKAGYFLGESSVILVVMAVPLILTGLMTGLDNKRWSGKIDQHEN